VLLIYEIARRLFDRRCALVAGLLAAFYKVFFYYDALLLKVPLSVFLISLALLLLLRAASRNRRTDWFAGGLCLGIASLTRGNYLLFLPVLLGWIGLASDVGRARRVVSMSAVVFGFFLAIAPVTIRNRAVGDDWVLTTSGAGSMFYLANNRGNPTGRNSSPPFLRPNPVHEEDDFRLEAERRTGREMKPSELSRFWFGEGMKEIRADPSHFLRHTLFKVALFFNHYEVPDNQNYYFFETHVAPMLRVPMPTYGVLLPFALCGMFIARRNRTAGLLTLFFFTHAVSLVIIFNTSRYRIPVVPVAIVFAAVALVRLHSWVVERRLREIAVAVGFVALAYPVIYLNLISDDFAMVHYNIGTRHLESAKKHHAQSRALERAGEVEAAQREVEAAASIYDLAEEEFRRAMEIDPRRPAPRYELRGLLILRIAEAHRVRDDARAIELSRELTAAFPRFAEGFVLLGQSYARLGRTDEARRALRRALALSPRHSEARSELERLPQQ
jgi:4-amino-4-deoxy-L-arabinose transferase-like glycosyltransferase